MFGFRRRPDPNNDDRRALEAGIRAHLGLGEDDSVKIYEVACGVPDCPDVVTAMLIIRQNLKAEIYRVAKPLSATSIDDLAAAMRPPRDASGAVASAAHGG